MFVVDSSVWIDHFAARWGRETSLLRQALEGEGQPFLCGPVLQEVLQGFRRDADFIQERRNLAQFPFLDTSRWTFFRAASLYRFLRKKGITVNSFDTTIATVCMENHLPLLTCNRRDFEPIARHAGLKLA